MLSAGPRVANVPVRRLARQRDVAESVYVDGKRCPWSVASRAADSTASTATMSSTRPVRPSLIGGSYSGWV